MPAVHSVLIKVNGTALGATVQEDIIEVIVDTALSLPGTFSIVIANDDQANDTVFSTGSSVEISFLPADEGGETNKAMIKGIVTAIEPVYTEEGSELLRVRGYEKSIKLTQGTKTRTYNDVTDADIFKRIAGNNGLSCNVDSTTVNYPHLIQYNQSDWDFLQDLARKLGFLTWMDGDTLNFKKPPNGTTVELAWPDDLTRFEPRLSYLGQHVKANVKGWEAKQKKEITGASSSGNSQSYRSIGASDTGAKLVSSNVGSSVAETIIDLALVSQAQANAIAQAEMDRAEACFVTAEGECRGDAHIVAGCKVKISKVSARFAGTYLVTQARHEYTNSDYTTYFSINGAAPETILSLLVDPEATRGNRIDGVVTALVTNVDDPDKANRVKVKYPWLVETNGNPVESNWARLAIPGGGKNRGIAFVPEVDDEVLVAFAGGDINAPYIVGALWNGKDAALTGLLRDHKVAQRVVRSRSGHVIILDDTDGSECITIKDKTENNSIVINSKDNTMTFKSKGNLTIQSDGDVTIQGKGKLVMKSDADASIESSTGKATVKAATELALSGMTKANVTGGNVAKLDLQASGAKMEGPMAEVSGQATASLKGGAMVEVQGGLVKIN